MEKILYQSPSNNPFLRMAELQNIKLRVDFHPAIHRGIDAYNHKRQVSNVAGFDAAKYKQLCLVCKYLDFRFHANQSLYHQVMYSVHAQVCIRLLHLWIEQLQLSALFERVQHTYLCYYHQYPKVLLG